MGRGEYQRSNVRISTESLLCIRLADLKKNKCLKPGRSYLLHWSRDGEKFASVRFTVGYCSTSFEYIIKDNADKPLTVSRTIPLTFTPCHFGGNRKWFCCSCGRKVATIFICGQYVACRRCFNAAYPSQREDAIDRLSRKIYKLEAKVEDGYGRPKGMHMRTFDRIRDEWIRLNIKKDELIESEFSRRFPRGME